MKRPSAPLAFFLAMLALLFGIQAMIDTHADRYSDNAQGDRPDWDDYRDDEKETR